MTLNQFIGLIMILGALVGILWGYMGILKKSEDPARILFKTVISVAMAIGFVVFIWNASGPALLIAVVLGLIMGGVNLVLWSGHLTNAFARPFENLFTGGDVEADPEPFYSIARTKRHHGHPALAIQLIEEQFETFPDDYNGLMLKAEIQAVDQQNLSGAAATVERICETQNGHPKNVANALSALADWHLQVYRDRDAAAACFERIRKEFPKNEVAVVAAQRLAHLPSQEMLDGRVERRSIVMQERPKVVIRDRSDVKVELPEEHPEDAISRLELQLEVHPLDQEAREELAALLAEHRGDLEAALHQLEWLFKQQKTRQTRVKLLQRMTDYCVRYSDDLARAQRPLDRIMELYPDSGPAEQALQRKMLLRKEFQGKKKNRDVHLGSYERDLGLR